MLCEQCGRPIPTEEVGINDEDEFLKRMRHRQGMQVYRSTAGKWLMTYGGGQVSEALVARLAASRVLKPCYSDCPNDAFWLGQTVDMIATMEKRRRSGNRNIVVYL